MICIVEFKDPDLIEECPLTSRSSLEGDLSSQVQDKKSRENVAQKELEEQIQKQKKKQAMMETMHVFVAMLAIVLLSVLVVALKIFIFPEDREVTFIPQVQQTLSVIKYTGNGFIPCQGVVPTPPGCHFPPYDA